MQTLNTEALRVIHAAVDIYGDIGQALSWYPNEPLAAFGYETAEQLVGKGRGEDLIRYVISLSAGVTG